MFLSLRVHTLIHVLSALIKSYLQSKKISEKDDCFKYCYFLYRSSNLIIRLPNRQL